MPFRGNAAFPHDADQHPENAVIRSRVEDDRLHFGIRRVQAYLALVAVEALERHLVVDHRHDTGAVVRGVLLANHDPVAVVDVVLNHRLSADLEGVILRVAEQVAEVEAVAIILHRLDRSARGDVAEQRQLSRRTGPEIDELDGPRFTFLAHDQPLLLQRLEMTHHPVRRQDAEVVADVAHRRSVTLRLDEMADVVVNLALPFGQLAEVWHV